MKTINEIKFITEQANKKRADSVVKDLIIWLEDTVIPMSINRGETKLWIHEWDRQIGLNFDEIKPILEASGFKVERAELRSVEKRWIGKDKEYVNKYVQITWE